MCIQFSNQSRCVINELSVNRKDVQASTLVGLTQENPALDPLAVLNLDNRLYDVVET